MSDYQDKLGDLCHEYGCSDVHEMIEEYGLDSCVPCICMNDGCMATYEYEPDSWMGWCDECGTNSVKSFLILEGII